MSVLAFAVGVATLVELLVLVKKESTKKKIIYLSALIVPISLILGMFIKYPLFIMGIVAYGLIINRCSEGMSHGKIVTLEDKVKVDLGIQHVKTVHKRFIRPLRWVGGMISPLFPFFSVTNTAWKKKGQKEAKIHELMHIHLLIKEYWILNLVAMIILFSFIFYYTINPFLGTNNTTSVHISTLIATALTMTIFEWVTFIKTRSYASTLGITTRKFNKKLFVKYMVIYLLQIIILYGLINGVVWLGKRVLSWF